MSKTNNATNRTLTLKKVIDAPVKLVWEAWTNSDHVVQWWAPKGMKINVVNTALKLVVNGNIVCPCLMVICLFRKENT